MLKLIAAATFLIFTVSGYLAQVRKLFLRQHKAIRGEIPNEDICAGLSQTREVFSFVAFLSFALSGMTRSFFVWMLVLCRAPVVIATSVILWFIAQYEGKSKLAFWFSLFGLVLLFGCAGMVLSGVPLAGGLFAKSIDCLVLVTALPLVYGKTNQAYQMYRTRRVAAVSLFREFGLVLKDLTGFLYAYSVGSELYAVALMHALSFFSSMLISMAKVSVELAEKRN